MLLHTHSLLRKAEINKNLEIWQSIPTTAGNPRRRVKRVMAKLKALQMLRILYDLAGKRPEELASHVNELT